MTKHLEDDVLIDFLREFVPVFFIYVAITVMLGALILALVARINFPWAEDGKGFKIMSKYYVCFVCKEQCKHADGWANEDAFFEALGVFGSDLFEKDFVMICEDCGGKREESH